MAREEVRLDCTGGFVLTMVYRFSRPTGDLDVLEAAPRDAGRAALERGMQGSVLHRKYEIYLDHVGMAHVPGLRRSAHGDISENLQTSSALSS